MRTGPGDLRITGVLSKIKKGRTMEVGFLERVRSDRRRVG